MLPIKYWDWSKPSIISTSTVFYYWICREKNIHISPRCSWMDGWMKGWMGVRNRQEMEREHILRYSRHACSCLLMQSVFLRVLRAWCYSLSVKVALCLLLFGRSLFPGLAVSRWYQVNLLYKTNTGGQHSLSWADQNGLVWILFQLRGNVPSFCLLVLTIDHHRGNSGRGWMESHWGLEIETSFKPKALPAASLSGLRGLFLSGKR